MFRKRISTNQERAHLLLSRKDYWKAPNENEKKILGALLDYHLSSFSTTTTYSKSIIFVKYLVDYLLLLLVIHHSPMRVIETLANKFVCV